MFSKFYVNYNVTSLLKKQLLFAKMAVLCLLCTKMRTATTIVLFETLIIWKIEKIQGQTHVFILFFKKFIPFLRKQTSFTKVIDLHWSNVNCICYRKLSITNLKIGTNYVQQLMRTHGI